MEKTTDKNEVEQGDPSIARPQPAMASEKVLYVGQIVAMVIAETRTVGIPRETGTD